MSLFTEYLASLEAAKVESEVAKAAAKAKAEAAEDQLLEDSGLAGDYQELLETEAVVNQQFQTAKAEVQTFAFMAQDADYAASLVEQKAQAIESLVQEMEAQGLLADQVAATKQSHLDSALASHLAAKAAKERVAKLLANKKIK